MVFCFSGPNTLASVHVELYADPGFECSILNFKALYKVRKLVWLVYLIWSYIELSVRLSVDMESCAFKFLWTAVLRWIFAYKITFSALLWVVYSHMILQLSNHNKKERGPRRVPLTPLENRVTMAHREYFNELNKLKLSLVSPITNQFTIIGVKMTLSCGKGTAVGSSLLLLLSRTIVLLRGFQL